MRNSDRKARSKRLNSCCTCKHFRTHQSEEKIKKSSHKKQVNTTNKKKDKNVSDRKLRIEREKKINMRLDYSDNKSRKVQKIRTKS